MPTLTLSRALLRLSGVGYYNLGSVLTHHATQALWPFLESHGFDLGQPINVRELRGPVKKCVNEIRRRPSARAGSQLALH
jgi:hypothetical protein